MTTIATDGERIAADSRACRNDTLVTEAIVKLATLSDGSILGLAGRASTLPQLAAWMEGKGDFPKNCGEWSAIRLMTDGPRFYSSDAGEAWFPMDTPAATGSGCDFAVGAMLAGASPAEAVEIASARDPFTGGPVVTLKLDH